MKESLYQDIFDKMQCALPNNWKKVILYVAYMEGSYSMKYYVQGENREYQDCFSLGTLPKVKIVRLFMELDKMISPVRKNLAKNDKWSCMTMIVDASGKFRTKFDYEEIEDPIEYEQKWKKKILV